MYPCVIEIAFLIQWTYIYWITNYGLTFLQEISFFSTYFLIDSNLWTWNCRFYCQAHVKLLLFVLWRNVYKPSHLLLFVNSGASNVRNCGSIFSTRLMTNLNICPQCIVLMCIDLTLWYSNIIGEGNVEILYSP